MKKKHKGKRQPKGDTLTNQQVNFCEHYILNGSNGAEAYGRAYPGSMKHTPQYRAEKASKLLAEAKIKAKINDLRPIVKKVVEETFEITAEKIIQEYASIAFANADDYYEWGYQDVPRVNRKTGEPVIGSDGQQIVDRFPTATVKPSAELSRRKKAAISGVELSYSQSGMPVLTVKMSEKRAALKELAQIQGLYKEQVKHEHSWVDAASASLDGKLAGLAAATSAAGVPVQSDE